MLQITVKLIKNAIILLLMMEHIFNYHGTAHISLLNLGLVDATSDIEKNEGIPQKRSVSGKKAINIYKYYVNILLRY